MSDEGAGKYAYEGLERVLHEKARLSILTSLFTHRKGLPFRDIKNLCSLTDGNLSRHLQVLEREELVEITKAFVNGRPKTTCKLTKAGRKRFQAYIVELQAVIQATKGVEEKFEPGISPA